MGAVRNGLLYITTVFPSVFRDMFPRKKISEKRFPLLNTLFFMQYLHYTFYPALAPSLNKKARLFDSVSAGKIVEILKNKMCYLRSILVNRSYRKPKASCASGCPPTAAKCSKPIALAVVGTLQVLELPVLLSCPRAPSNVVLAHWSSTAAPTPTPAS